MKPIKLTFLYQIHEVLSLMQELFLKVPFFQVPNRIYDHCVKRCESKKKTEI